MAFSGTRDSLVKFRGYFQLPSVAHCLILVPDEAVVLHHARRPDGAIETEALSEGTLRLDPPGLEVDVQALFARL